MGCLQINRYCATSSASGSTVFKQTNVAEPKLVSDGAPSLQLDVVRIGPDGSAVFMRKGSRCRRDDFKQNKVLAQTTVSAIGGRWQLTMSR